MTAPAAPPSTIKAAVSWATSLILPPSIRRPPKIPANATNKPARVTRSGRERSASFDGLPGMSSVTLLIGGLARRFRQTALREGRKLPAEGDNPPDNLIGGFEHHELLAVRQTDDGVGSDFDVLDQVGVQHKGDTIESSEADHS